MSRLLVWLDHGELALRFETDRAGQTSGMDDDAPDRNEAADAKAELLPPREVMSLLGGASGMPVPVDEVDSLLGGPAFQGGGEDVSSPADQPAADPQQTQTASSET